MRKLAFVLASLQLGACGWEFDVPPVRLIDRTRMLGTKVEVIELDPAWPERVGYDPDDAPISEAMPGDRVRLSAMVVAADGRALPAADFDAIWYQCSFTYGGCPVEVPPCEDVEWTTLSTCELGRGGEIEFEIPPLEAIAPGTSEIPILGFVALDPSFDVERCTKLFADPGPEFEHCAIILGSLQIGPPWLLQLRQFEAGLEVAFPVTEIPAPALFQPANRIPLPSSPLWFDTETNLPLVGDPIVVRRGQRIRGEPLVWRVVDQQPVVSAEPVVEGESYVFIGSIEELYVYWYYSVGLTPDFGLPIEYEQEDVHLIVDEQAELGRASVVLMVADDRGSRDFRSIAFEVVP